MPHFRRTSVLMLAIVLSACLVGFTPPTPGPTHGPVPAGTTTALTGPVVGVHDGDTITVALEGGVKHIRFIGIDAPELHQAPWGAAALGLMQRLVANRTVTIQPYGVDLYGRTLAHVFVGDVWVNRELVLAGLAVCKNYGKKVARFDELKAAEAIARQAKLNLWGDPAFVDPQTFRHDHGIGRHP